MSPITKARSIEILTGAELSEFINLSQDEKQQVYRHFIESEDEILRKFKDHSELWALRILQFDDFIKEHQPTRGSEYEELIKNALKEELGVTSNRVYKGLIVDNGVCSTEMDVIVIKKNIKPIFCTETFIRVERQDVLVAIEVKSTITGMRGKGEASINGILNKNTNVSLDSEDIFYGVFGFKSKLREAGLQKGQRNLGIIQDIVSNLAPRNFLMVASDKYFVRRYQTIDGFSSDTRHYYFENGLAFGYFMANILHHIDIHDGKESWQSINTRFPMLSKTPAQVFPWPINNASDY